VSDAFNVGDKLRKMEQSYGKVPALGLSWANAVTTRVMLSRTEHNVTVALHESKAASTKQRDSSVAPRTYEANVRHLSVLFAPHLPSSRCRFIVDEDGVKGLPVNSVS